MSKLTRIIGCVIPLCLIVAGAIQAATPSQPDSRLNTYRDVDGQVYFVLNLRPTIQPTTNANRDILVLVDTSASQTGRFRTQSLEAVEQVIDGLQDGERAHVAAIDLSVVPMTNGFTSGKQLKAGFAKLKARTPLGATDMVKGLQAAVELFEDNDHDRSIIYIGDGMSRANLIAPDELRQIVTKVVENKVSINSYAIGVRRDIDSLAILANNSGGSVFLDGESVTAQQAGQTTLQLARAAVVWPKDVNWAADITEVFPQQMPPLRYDRDTLMIGTMVATDNLELSAFANVAGKKQELKWSLVANDATKNDDYAIVPDLVSSARPNDGLTMTLLGQEGFDLARRTYQNSSQNLSKLGKQALTRGDIKGGLGLLKEALRRDPGNIEAKALLKSNTAVQETGTKGVQLLLAQADDIFGDDPLDVGDAADDIFGGDDAGDAGDDLFGGDDVADEAGGADEVFGNDEPAEETLPAQPTEVPADVVADEPTGEPLPVAPTLPEPTPSVIAPTPMSIQPEAGIIDYGYGQRLGNDSLTLGNREGDSDSDLLRSAQEEREIQEQLLRTEVQRAIKLGNNRMSADPAATIETLKNLRESIIQSPDISPAARAELLDRLELGLRQASSLKIQKDRTDEAARANLAELQARSELMAASVRERDMIRSYLNQINALLDEGKFQLAEEVALEMQEKAPRRVAPQIAVTKSGIVGNFNRIKDLYATKQRRYLDALWDVDRSSIPFPDSEPIQYPDADVWRELSDRRIEKYSKSDLGESGPAELRILSALDENTQLEFNDDPLATAMQTIEERHNIPIEFDDQALEDETIDPSSDPVSIDVSNISLRSAMRLMLEKLNLTYVIDNEVLMITSKTKAEETLITKVYPVGDLVMPLNAMSMMGGGMMGGMGGGMMGGMGGGMMGGGMGGGMMGGGMGGGMMGGGMGGMGGGMGGMGGGMGGGMFDVEDAIQLGDRKAKKAVAAPVQAKPAAAKKKVARPITVTPRKGESLDAAWDRYFSQLDNMELTAEQEAFVYARVRATVLKMSEKREFDQVVAVIQSSLRNTLYQPWMYQTLTSTLRITGADQSEIERAILSTVDLSSNTDQMLAVAVNMRRLGLEERALQLFRDLGTANPLRPEPYAHALACAKNLNDRESITWACKNVLGQAWPKEHQQIFDQALLTAKATVHDLRMAGKNAEADDLEAVMTEALQRDIVVQVTWTGEADIDISIQEPAGTVCSFRNDRTTSGGILLGGLPDASKKSVDGTTETYVCPKAFNGQYKVFVEKIWGDVAAGKVNVEIFTNVTPTHRTVVSQQIDLSEKNAMLNFQLENGRREQKLEDQVIANAAVRHIAANRAILAQQFDGNEDTGVASSSTLSDLALLRTRDPRTALRLERALRGRGEVGFMPQLTVLPEGTTMSGQAVISADRRYVRVSMSPNFSRIADVATFNFQTGAGGGGAGGQGQAAGGQAGGGFGGGGFGGGAF